MKKIDGLFWFLISLFFLFPFYNCQRNDPETVINKFSMHWYRGELEEASRYITPESKETAKLLLQGRSEKSLADKKNNVVENNFIEKTLTDDSTMLYQCETRINGDLVCTQYLLRKIDGKWYIDINY